jgi:type I restriction enzyme S subunit
MQAGNGMFAICKTPGLISPDYRAFELTDEADPNYLIALFKSEAMRATFRAESKGLGTGTAGFLRLYPDRFGSLFAPFPPVGEQRLLAGFIDAYTAQVQRVLAVKRRTIAVLVERARSIITDELYREADGSASACPKRAEWPMLAIKRVASVAFSSVDKHIHGHELSVRVCNYVDVYKNERITSETMLREGSVTQAELENFQLRSGDVLITKDSEDWRDICVPALVVDAPPKTVCGYHLAILHPNVRRITGEYLYFALLAAPTTWQFHRAASGITRYGIGKNEIGTAQIPIPSLGEQMDICRRLSQDLASINSARSRIAREIDLVVEYRDAMIAAIVTGQLDVREAEVAAVAGSELVTDLPSSEEMEDALEQID